MGCSLSVMRGPEIASEPLESTSRDDKRGGCADGRLRLTYGGAGRDSLRPASGWGEMADTRKLDEAFNRFDAALRQFEAALERQNERKSHEESLEAAAEALRLDRSRLAQELDGVRAKATDLVTTNHKAVGKIDAAMSRIRAVLHSNSGGS